MAPVPPANESESTDTRPPGARVERDNLNGLKADLLTYADEQPSLQDRALGFVHERPYVSTAAALTAGLLIGAVPAARKIAAIAATFAAKRVVTAYALRAMRKR